MITEGILFKKSIESESFRRRFSSTGTHRFKPTHKKKKTAPKPRSPKENLPSVALVLLIVDDDLQHIIIQDIPIIANRLAYDSRLAKRLGAFILPFFPVNLYING